jgi:hypothetical protein
MSFLKRLFTGKLPAPASLGQDHAITGTVNLTAQLAGSSGRTMAVSSYIYDGESKESLEARLDLLQEVIERQRTRCEIPELEAKRDQMAQGMEQARQVMAELETRKKNGENLSSQERLNLRNISTNIMKMSEEINKGTAAIAEAKKKAGVGG